VTEPVLKSIEIEGFLSIRSATVQLGRLNVLVGANGAGKSNFVRAFELLGRLADQELGLFVGLNGGASALLNERDARIRLAVGTSADDYEATLLPAANEELIFGSETLHDRTTQRDMGFGGGHRESGLTDQQIAALFRGCRVFHFQDTSQNAPVKQFTSTGDNIALRNNAGNLAATLLNLRTSSKTKLRAYRRILGAVRQVAPFFRDFVLQPENDDRVRLRWQQNGSDAVFSANQMSDGTLRFICLATLLLHPALPELVVLDEPELGLHPFAIVQLADLLRQAATRSQVLFATQSVTLLSQFELADLIVAERQDGASVLRRPDPALLTDWLTEYSLGELWEKNLLGGGPERDDSDRDA
jgi:predicted ATPase